MNNQVMHQDVSLRLRSAFPPIPPDCLDALLKTACSVQNTQRQAYSIRNLVASAVVALICGTATFQVEFAFGAGMNDADTRLNTIMQNYKASGAAVVAAKDGEIVFEYWKAEKENETRFMKEKWFGQLYRNLPWQMTL